MATPKWAQDLTITAILYLQSKGLKAELPELTWRHGMGYQSSGSTINKTRIVVTAGKTGLTQNSYYSMR